MLGYLPGYLQEEGFEPGQRFCLLARLDALVGVGPLGPLDAAQWYQGVEAGGARRRRRLVLVAPTRGTARDGRPRVGPGGVGGPDHPDLPLDLLIVLAPAPLSSAWLAVPATLVSSAGALLYLEWWLPSAPSWPLHLTWGLGAATLALTALVALARRHPPRPLWRPVAG